MKNSIIQLNIALKIFLGAFLLISSLAPNTYAATEQKGQNQQQNNVVNKGKAKNPTKHSIGLGLGQTFLLGEFNSLGDDKITGDLFYAYRASYSFDFVLNLHHTDHSLNNKEASLTSVNMGIKSKIFDFDNFSPYITGGLGFYRPQVKRYVNGSLVESESKIVLGVNVGLGMELRLNNRVSTGVLGHYHKPFNSDQTGQPAVKGNYWKLLIVAMYTI